MTFAEIYPPGSSASSRDATRRRRRSQAPPEGRGGALDRHRRDLRRVERDDGGRRAPSVLVEAMIGGLGALVILLFTFGTLPAIAMPLIVALARSSTRSR